MSKVGKGTTFLVYIPVLDTEFLDTAEYSPVPRKGTEKILLVDDEKAMVNAVEVMLRRLEYQITSRISSLEALLAFRNEPYKYDIVITDMTMPYMTGKELAREIRKIRPDIPIILCTGYSDQIDNNIARALGINAFIMKPIEMTEMANTIRDLLDNKHLSI